MRDCGPWQAAPQGRFGPDSPAISPPGGPRRKRWESAGKPGSVLDNHSSGTHVAVRLKRPTRKRARAARCSSRLLASLFGLAPGGVCRAVPVTRTAVRSYRTVSPLPACVLAQAHFGGLLSVALSVGLRPPGVTWRPALWSPDFPHRTAPATTGQRMRAARLPSRLPLRPYADSTPSSSLTLCIARTGSGTQRERGLI